VSAERYRADRFAATPQGGVCVLSYFTAVCVYARKARENDIGATAVEYGLIVALIAALIVTALTTLGPALSGVFAHMSRVISGSP
jgi:pilus assembly protein Flp/PilA